MAYLHGGERVLVSTDDWEAHATVQSVSEPKSTEVDNEEYVTVRIEETGVISGDPDTGLVTVDAFDVVEVK